MGQPHQKHSGHHTLNQDHKNGVAEILVQNCEERHHNRYDQDKKDCGAALAVRLLVETSKVNQPEQQQQNRRPVASQHRYELQSAPTTRMSTVTANAFCNGIGRELN